MLTASSPIEIEAKSDEVGLSTEAHDAALRLFHDLTDRIGQAVVTLDISFEDWPTHRFYFSAEPAGLERLLTALHARHDILDVSTALPTATDEDASAGSIAGLFALTAEDGFTGILIAHQDHTGYAPP